MHNASVSSWYKAVLVSYDFVANYDQYSKADNGDMKYSKLKNLIFQTTSSLTQKGKQEIRLLLLSDIGKTNQSCFHPMKLQVSTIDNFPCNVTCMRKFDYYSADHTWRGAR